MFTTEAAFSGFSVDDIDAAETFYRDILGLGVERTEMHTLMVQLPGGGEHVIYPKPAHVPAEFTVLNFAVHDVDRAVTELNDLGVVTKIYADDELSCVRTDERGVAKGFGPDIAWFRDPAGNVLSVIKADR